MMSTPADKPNQGNGAADSGGADDFKNLKAEIDRKLGNVKTDVAAALKQSQDSLMSQLQAMLKPQPAQPSVTPDDDLEGTFYKDPKAYAAKVAEMTERRIEEKFSKREQETQKRQVTVAGLYKEFPELNTDDHELTQLAVKKYQEMSKEYGDSPATYKAAVSEAALELGVKPKSKRPAEDDSYSVGSGRGRERGAQRKSDELDPRTIEAAKLMGVDPEKVKARVKSRNKFGNWE
jgi:hypothetical protein